MAFYLPALVSAKKKAIDTRDYLEGRTTPDDRRSYAPHDLGAVVGESWGPPVTQPFQAHAIEVETIVVSAGGGGGNTVGDPGAKESQIMKALSPQ